MFYLLRMDEERNFFREGYHETMLAINKLMDKGEPNLSAAELKKLAVMSAAAQNMKMKY
jgi:hypothetical protein